MVMKNETVTLSQEPVAWANWKVGTRSYVPYRTREQAEACVRGSEIAATQLGPYKVVPLYAAALADPVPPEECVHDFRMFSSECAKCGADWIPGKDYSKAAPAVDVEVVYMLRNRSLGTTWRTADKEAYDSMATVLVYERRELVDRAHVTRLQAELADRKAKHLHSCQIAIGKSQLAKERHTEVIWLQAEVERLKEGKVLVEIAASQVVKAKESLQAEVERLNTVLSVTDAAAQKWLADRTKLQSELTKARELFGSILDNPRLVLGVPSALLVGIKDFIAHQSAPAAKDGADDCAHSEANKHGCPECGEEFKP